MFRLNHWVHTTLSELCWFFFTSLHWESFNKTVCFCSTLKSWQFTFMSYIIGFVYLTLTNRIHIFTFYLIYLYLVTYQNKLTESFYSNCFKQKGKFPFKVIIISPLLMMKNCSKCTHFSQIILYIMSSQQISFVYDFI